MGKRRSGKRERQSHHEQIEGHAAYTSIATATALETTHERERRHVCGKLNGGSLPSVTFHVRVRDESIGGDNPFKWVDVTSEDYFKGKKVVLFSLPGAFTPTCSTYQLPGFEKNAEEFKKLGIDEIYCLSVN